MTSIGVMASSVTAATTTFPTIATANTETGTSLGTANAIPSPSGVVAGDLLVANVSNDGGGTVITASTGWTEVVQANENGPSPHRLACFVRIADGGANDSLSLTGATDDYCASILRITGHGVTTIASDIKFASAIGTTSTVVDPPNLDAGSVRKWLWVAVAGVDQNTGGQVNGSPVGYTSAHANLSAGSVGSGLGVAYKTNEVQAENPASWGTSSARPWAAFTLAVPPV